MNFIGHGVESDHTSPSKLALELSASDVLPNGKLPEMSTYLRANQTSEDRPA